MADGAIPYPAAPYHADVARGPVEGRAVWATTSDGIRLRVAVWQDGSRGTLVMCPGRTEYVEKYSDAAREMQARGYASVAIDWRGQGLSPRPEHDKNIGHVNNFNYFQRDVDALLELCAALNLPRPWHILGHSMGGLIGLRTLMRTDTFEKAVFSAPMWGLKLAPHRRAVGWGVSAMASLIGLGQRAAPGSGKIADPIDAPFDDNLLTTDPEMFAWMKRQLAAHPELALGGPSLAWIWAAFREMHTTAREAAPKVPCLTFLGTDEGIVSDDSIHVRMGSWPNSQLEMIEGARHEVLMETPETRNRVFDQIAAFLNK